MMGEGETNGLPPGPWVAKIDDGNIVAFVDAEGAKVVDAVWDDWHGSMIEASPAVLRAVEALPTLAAAARAIVATGITDPENVLARCDFPHFPLLMRLDALRDALAAIDGGRDDSAADDVAGPPT